MSPLHSGDRSPPRVLWQSPPSLTQFVLVGTDAEPALDDGGASAAADADAKEHSKGEKGERRYARPARHSASLHAWSSLPESLSRRMRPWLHTDC